MEFRLWLEAKFDPLITTPIPYKNATGKPYLGKNFSLKIDNQGNIAPLSQEDWNSGVSHMTINPGNHSISLQKLSPQSLMFRKMINALRSKYHDIDTWIIEHFFMAGHYSPGNKLDQRTVGYWMKQNTVNLQNKIPDYFYHGTSTNLWYEGIKQKGLLPRGLSGSFGSYGAQNVDSLSHSNLVYLSAHPDFATRTAAQQSAEKYGGRPMILKISSSGLFPNKFVSDEDVRNVKTAQQSIDVGSILAYTGKIPPSLLEPFLIGERILENNRYHFKWEKFHDVPVDEHPLMDRLRQNYLPTSYNPEYFALLDAGVLGEENDKTVLLKQISNEELKQILKKATWASNAVAIYKDLGSWDGIISRLRNHILPADISPESDKVIKMLEKSGIARIEKYSNESERKYIEIRSYGDKVKQSIDLAKLMGKIDWREFVSKIKEIEAT